MPSRRQDDLDRELARWTDQVEQWALAQLALIYAAIDTSKIDASFAIAVPRLTALYGDVVAAVSAGVNEYQYLTGVQKGIAVTHNWERTRRLSTTVLPSGLDTTRFFASAPYGTKAAISRGLPPADALKLSLGKSAQAVSTIPHLVVRETLASSTLAERQAEVEWPKVLAPADAAPIIRNPAIDHDLTPYLHDIDASIRSIESFANMPPDEVLTAESFQHRRALTRWRRVPSPGACDFCLTLASRGAVYTRTSATTVGKGRTPRRSVMQPNGNRYHYHCRCRAVIDYADLPDLVISREDWERLTTRGDDGKLPTFGIGRSRYDLSYFSTAVYDGPEPPFPRWGRK